MEVAGIIWDHRLEPVSQMVSVTLIPYARRGEENDWLDLISVIPTVLVDRPRWLDLLQRSGQMGEAIAEMPRSWMLEELVFGSLFRAPLHRSGAMPESGAVAA